MLVHYQPTAQCMLGALQCTLDSANAIFAAWLRSQAYTKTGYWITAVWSSASCQDLYHRIAEDVAVVLDLDAPVHRAAGAHQTRKRYRTAQMLAPGATTSAIRTTPMEEHLLIDLFDEDIPIPSLVVR